MINCACYRLQESLDGVSRTLVPRAPSRVRSTSLPITPEGAYTNQNWSSGNRLAISTGRSLVFGEADPAQDLRAHRTSLRSTGNL